MIDNNEFSSGGSDGKCNGSENISGELSLRVFLNVHIGYSSLSSFPTSLLPLLCVSFFFFVDTVSPLFHFSSHCLCKIYQWRRAWTRSESFFLSLIMKISTINFLCYISPMCYAKITNASTHERTQSLDMLDCTITQLRSTWSRVILHCIPYSSCRHVSCVKRKFFLTGTVNEPHNKTLMESLDIIGKPTKSWKDELVQNSTGCGKCTHF